MSASRNFILIIIVIVVSIIVFLSYMILQERKEREAMQALLYQLHDRLSPEELLAKKVSEAQPVVTERVVTKVEAWRPVQEKVKDTVVQVFVQVAEVDLRQPYKTPNQYAAFGSGFFITAAGDIVTNAHVVEHAKSVWIQIPSLGKRQIDVNVLSIAPERDLALLRVSEEGRKIISQELGCIPHLSLGDSDLVRRAEEVMAVGYPLAQGSLKSTTGVISGRESHMIQMSAAINPGSSGGPLLNLNGEVVGINTAGVVEAQNVAYIIPINDLKTILPDLYKEKILHKPFLGVIYNNTTEAMPKYLGNPEPGGCYVVEVVNGSVLHKAGVQGGDMIYAFNGYPVDMYGEMNVPWSEDKVSISDYIARLANGDEVNLVVYRNGTRKEVSVALQTSDQPAIRKVFPAFEDIDYEVFGGMVVMQLTLNHIAMLAKSAPGLMQYVQLKNQQSQVLVITHVLPTSHLARTRIVAEGATINDVNGEPVQTLADFRAATGKSLETGYLTLTVSDNVARVSDNIFVVMPIERVLGEERRLAFDYKYHLTVHTQECMLAWQRGHNQMKDMPTRGLTAIG